MLRSSKDPEGPHARRAPWFLWPLALALVLLVSASGVVGWSIVSPEPVSLGWYFLAGPRCDVFDLNHPAVSSAFPEGRGSVWLGYSRLRIGPAVLYAAPDIREAANGDLQIIEVR